VITTTGNPVYFNAEYSVAISNNHGGMRVVMDPGTADQTIFGGDSLYGLDWQSHFPGTWIKRSMTRVFTGIPAGTHVFRMQYRAQCDGCTITLSGGSCDMNALYSGSHLFIQEL
jgi:hypothetical protein